MMRHTLQVLKGIEPEVEHSSAQPLLPLLATANDVRGVVQYLRTRPEGVTVSEAIGASKKEGWEPAKIEAYEARHLMEGEGIGLRRTQVSWSSRRILT